MKRIGFLLLVSLCLPKLIFAQQNISLEDKIIASTFKTLAKAFVAVADIEGLKRNSIHKVNNMKPEKFQKHYAKAYAAIKDLPPSLKIAYGISLDMSKEQAIKNIDSLDKKKIYEAIEAIPDTFIARQFKLYLSQKKEEIQKSNLVAQINKIWAKLLEGSKFK